MIRPMSDRSGSLAQATVCPFIAYDDDRDGRGSVPDHRHRCFAETPAAPRALAHQAAYCLSSTFAGCPTFLDWARREAAPVRETTPLRPARDAAAPRLGDRLEAGPISRLAAGDRPVPEAPRGGAERDSPAAWPTREADVEDEDEAPSAGWAAPPPWGADRVAAPSHSAPGHSAPAVPSPDDLPPPPAPAAETWGEADDAAMPAFLASRGRAGSGGRLVVDAAGHAPGAASTDDEPDDGMAVPVTPRRSPVGYSPAGRGRQDDRRRGASSRDPVAPSWERPRTIEQYPSLRTHSGLPSLGRIPRLGVYIGVVAVGVVVMFTLPFLLRGGGGGPAPSPSPSPVVSASPSVATPVPSATPFVYTVVARDTLSTIAAKYHVTLDQIMKANPSIKDPNKIAIGDQIVIPTAGASGGTTITQAPSPSPSP